MNQDVLKGNWKQLKGKIKQQWGSLTDDDLQQAAGDRDLLIGRMQARYGWAKDRAETELDRFMKASKDETDH